MRLGREYGCPEELEDLKERVRQDVIRQMDPHFIFNTLGAIRIATMTNAALAYDMIYDFSKYLRFLLRSLANCENILFKEEAACIISYINLEKLRFGNNIMLCMDIKTDDFMLPPFCVQPLVDNAIRHGLQKGRRKGVITVRSFRSSSEYIVQVEDDGKGFDAAGYNRRRGGDSPEAGGLQRVRYLMEHMAGGSVDIRSFPDIGTIITLHIPKDVQGGKQERYGYYKYEDESHFSG